MLEYWNFKLKITVTIFRHRARVVQCLFILQVALYYLEDVGMIKQVGWVFSHGGDFGFSKFRFGFLLSFFLLVPYIHF